MVRVPEDEVHLRLEPCSAVVIGFLGVHTGMSGAFSGLPHRRSGPCIDQTTLFALLQSGAFE
jgi:hypothetical protein